MVMAKDTPTSMGESRPDGCREVFVSHIFSGLAPEEYAELLGIASHFDREAGDLIFQEGMPARGIYVISWGRVKLVQQTPDKRKKQILRILGPGDLLGEEAFFAGGSYAAYARALEPTRFVFFPGDEFVAFLVRHPAVTLKLLETLAQEVKSYQRMLVELAYEKGEERLARLLLELARQSSGRETEGRASDLGLTRTELAELLGLRPETTIRILRRWQDEGILAVEGRRLILLDEAKLIAYARPPQPLVPEIPPGG
jgi:CRP/FNR family transcriptional regulator